MCVCKKKAAKKKKKKKQLHKASALTFKSGVFNYLRAEGLGTD